MSRLKGLLTNPWFSGMAAVASIAGFAFGIYAYQAARQTRELAVYPDPATAVLFKAGTTSKLAVTFNGQPITSDVTVAQVFIWNEGKMPILRESILSPIELVTNNRVPILDATLRARTRDVTDAAIDMSKGANGRLGVTWKILEQGDGMLVQLILGGGPETQISLQGIIQKPIKMTTVFRSKFSWSFIPWLLIASAASYVFQHLAFRLLQPKSVKGIVAATFAVLLIWLPAWFFFQRYIDSPLKPPPELMATPGSSANRAATN